MMYSGVTWDRADIVTCGVGAKIRGSVVVSKNLIVNPFVTYKLKFICWSRQQIKYQRCICNSEVQCKPSARRVVSY